MPTRSTQVKFDAATEAALKAALTKPQLDLLAFMRKVWDCKAREHQIEVIHDLIAKGGGNPDTIFQTLVDLIKEFDERGCPVILGHKVN